MALFLTPAEVAERWACSERHVERLCQTGRLRAMRLGATRWRIKLDDVAAYEQHQTTAAGSVASAEAPTAEPLRTVFGTLDDAGDLPLPERWWEQPTTAPAASSAAGRGRSAGTRKAGSQRL